MNQKNNDNTDGAVKPVSASKEASNKAMEAIKTGWAIFKERPWFSVALVILSQVVYSILDIPVRNTEGLTMAAWILAGQLISAFVTMSILYVFFRVYDKKEATFKHLFASWRIFVKYVLASILMMLAIVGGLILFIIPGIIIAIRLIFVPQLVVDKEMGAVEAVKKSWEITRGNMTYIISLMILTLGIAILGMLALMVGLLVAIPVSMYAFIHAYRSLLKANE